MIYCRDCKYWVQSKSIPEFGECRHNPPSPYQDKAGNDQNIGPYNFRAVWPFVRAVDYCGRGEKAQQFTPVVADQALIPSKLSPSFDAAVRAARSKA